MPKGKGYGKARSKFTPKSNRKPMSDKRFKKWEKSAKKHEKKFQAWKKKRK